MYNETMSSLKEQIIEKLVADGYDIDASLTIPAATEALVARMRGGGLRGARAWSARKYAR
ncbi:hypothetical protein SAMN05720766_101226 [Fibrobacter sp. UWH9]|nr:hypothetical protein SAMN05720766_101226 [Fibrobacter sp. UWH9]